MGECVSNLDRLGILRVSSRRAANEAEYDTLRAAVKSEFPGYNVAYEEESLAVTPFGRQFLKICIGRGVGRRAGHG